jgi:putative acetyltransferase
MMLIRDERDEDREAVHAVNVVAFGTPAEADLVDRLRRDADSYISLVAEADGRVIGHILFTPVTVSNRPRIDAQPEGQSNAQTDPQLRLIGLAPMAVATEYQRQGVGTALVGEGLARCAQAGYGAVVVLGHPGYYPRFGFRPAATYGLDSEYDSPPEAFMAIELQPGCLTHISGRVSYHRAFKEL